MTKTNAEKWDVVTKALDMLERDFLRKESDKRFNDVLAAHGACKRKAPRIILDTHENNYVAYTIPKSYVILNDEDVQPDHVIEGNNNERRMVNKTSL
jgi:hypothetical protein